MSELLAAYRRTGADPPFTDPARSHGAGMEGYYWRLVHPEDGWVIVWLCGVCQGRGPSWATVALASHPGGFLRHGTVEPAAGDFERFGARAGDVFRGSLHELRVRMADDAWVEARLRPRVTWPRRALGGLGPGQVVPGLAQYWHPVLLAAEVEGEACVGGRRLRLEGAHAYVEKNWGPGFAGRWWWGQASAFPDPDVGVAFAGGQLPMLGVSAAPTAVVVQLGERVLRFAPPLATAQVRSSMPSRRSPASSSGSRLASGVRLCPPHRSREPLRTHEALERADHPPEHPQASPCGAIDRLHASFRDQLRPTVGAGRAPLGEEHAHGAGLVPIPEGVRPLEAGIVAGQRPDAPAQSRDEQVRVLLEDGEGVRSKELAERLVSSRPRDPPTNEPTERTRVREPHPERRPPELVGVRRGDASVMGADGGPR
jgi:tocopherol cyclase